MVTVSPGKTSVPLDDDVIEIDGLSTTSSATTFSDIVSVALTSSPSSDTATTLTVALPSELGIVTVTEPLPVRLVTNALLR